MILIADGGSTSCDWAVVDTQTATIVRQFSTEGLNPFQRTESEILSILTTEVAPQTTEYRLEKVLFYGAGVTPEKGVIVSQLLGSLFPSAQVVATSDMDGAIKGTVGDGDGIVAILGTGSNSVCCQGGVVTDKVAALGYILGDEGSGAVIGRTLLGDIFKGVAPRGIIEQFEAEYSLSQADILDSVYRQPQPNRFLASFTKFLSPRLGDRYIWGVVERCFEAFVRRNLAGYPLRRLCSGLCEIAL